MYGLDLRAIALGPQAYGCRRVLALVRGIPAPEPAWTTAHELGAQQLEATFEVVRTALAHMRMVADDKSRNRIKVPSPLRVPRPWDPPAEVLPVLDPEQFPPRMRVSSGASFARSILGGR